MRGEAEEDDEMPSLLVLESLAVVQMDGASLRETEGPSGGSFFIGVSGGVVGVGGVVEVEGEPPAAVSEWEGAVGGVSNGVSTTLMVVSSSS